MKALRSRIKDNRLLRTILFLAQTCYYGAQSLVTVGRWRREAAGTERYGLAAMIRVKDEARFLPEWIAHHVNLGVEHVFVYDNNSTDGIDVVLAPFVERGLVTYVPWPTVPASPSCEVDFLSRFGHHSRWVAFFDADEFLFEARPDALSDVLRLHDDRPAIAISWRYFGSAGHETIPHGLITEAFDRADDGCNRHVKVIAKPAMIHRHRNSHNFYYRRGRVAVTPEGRRVFGSFIAPPQQPVLVLHHYVYRSREDYERKTKRGFVDASGSRERSRHLSVLDAEFDRHNEVQVTPSESTVSATAELLRQLGLPDEIHARRPRSKPSLGSHRGRR